MRLTQRCMACETFATNTSWSLLCFVLRAIMLPSFGLRLLFWVGFLCITTSKPSSSVGDTRLGCIETERQALLKLKQGLNDPSGRLTSWVEEDCCKWIGIGCNNRTGHIVKVNLRNPYQLVPPHSSMKRQLQLSLAGDSSFQASFERSCVSGEINPSLLELKYLKHLDLSINCFGGMPIPKFIGSFTKLRYLNLSGSGFGGCVPHELGNLSALHYLDLNNDHWLFNAFVEYFYDIPAYELHVDSLDWVSHLSSLRYLDMGGLKFSKASNWLLSINMLPSLQKLVLHNCSLRHIPTSVPYVNFSTLSYLDLSENMLGPLIPTWMFNLSKLEYLFLSYNNFNGSNLTGLGKLCNLRTFMLAGNSLGGDIRRFEEGFSGCINSSLNALSLDSNRLSGHLPDWLWQFTNLKSLELSDNSLFGPLPASLGRLPFLRTLNLEGNQLNGSIPESLGQLRDLDTLVLGYNSFEGILSEAHFGNLTKLKTLHMRGNSLAMNVANGWIPPFQLTNLYMSDCKLGPKFPAWLQTQKELQELELSNASISDTIPDSFWNSTSNMRVLDLSSNSIEGSIGTSIGEVTTNMMFLSLYSNHLNGSIPSSICKMTVLTILQLSNNQLTGEIPQCLGDLQFLFVLDLRNNSLIGSIPSSVSNSSLLQSLHLGKNKLSGQLPASLKNCTSLVILNLGENRFSGTIPDWIGGSMPKLVLLILRSNKFDGNLPPQLSLLTQLQDLDLSQNSISGTIPTSFGNFSAMATGNRTLEPLYFGLMPAVFVLMPAVFEDDLVFWKGGEYDYSNTLSLMVNLDLSNNNLTGEIPAEIAYLFGLKNLNLSKNHFTGSIPSKIGNLQSIESLDLSWNQFSGVIPASFLDLTFLTLLNLSFNNFTGRIPSGNQFNTFNDLSIYMGNPNLCGAPLPNQCPGDGTSEDLHPLVDRETAEELKIHPFYIGMAVGFALGFLLVCGVLLLKKSWRIAYYHFFDDMRDWLYVIMLTKMAKLRETSN